MRDNDARTRAREEATYLKLNRYGLAGEWFLMRPPFDPGASVRLSSHQTLATTSNPGEETRQSSNDLTMATRAVLTCVRGSLGAIDFAQECVDVSDRRAKRLPIVRETAGGRRSTGDGLPIAGRAR
jgi:hypothetical protein